MLRVRPPRIRSARPRVEPLEGRALLASLMVINTLDSGAGSLRQAITDADAATGASTISFDIPGSGVRAIELATPLPNITAPVTIDGTTQPGYASGSPVVALDGRSVSVGSGLAFFDGASGSLVKGLAIERFQGPAIDIERPRVTVEDNVLGLDPTGATGGGNASGILLNDNFGNFGEDGTIISGNVIVNSFDGPGIDLAPADAAGITGNFIGTDATGRADIGNLADGIRARYGTIGTIVSNNTIANNGQLGIEDNSDGGLILANNALTNNGNQFVDLAVAATDSTIINQVGSTFTTTYTITNNGPATAASAGLTLFSRDALLSPGNRYGPPTQSAIFRFVGGETTVGTVAVDTYEQSVTASLGSLAPGASATVTVAVQLIGSGTDSVEAVATSTNPLSSPQFGPALTQVVGVGQANLGVVASPPPPAVVGSPETFSFVVTNRGPTAVADGQFALSLGPEAALSSASFQVYQGYVAGFGSFPGGFAGTLATLLPGASAVITATLTPPAVGPVTATLFAYSTYDTDPFPPNNLAFVAAPATTSPSVLGATLLPTTGAISALSVYFNTALNPSDAQNAVNYKLTIAGSSSRIALKSAAYDATTHVVTLRLARSLPRQGAALQLVVAGPGTPGLTGSDGSKLLNPGASFKLKRS